MKKQSKRKAREWWSCVVGKNIMTVARRRRDAVYLYTSIGITLDCEVVKVREVLPRKRK